MVKPIRIILAHKHQLIRHGLLAMLKQNERLQVLAEAASGPELKALCDQYQPDLILFALSTLDCPVDTFLLTIPQLCPSSKVAILATIEDAYQCSCMLTFKPHGYILKDEPEVVFMQALQAIVDGERWISPGVLERLTEQSREAIVLEPREYQLLALMAQGLTNKEIARHLGLANQTARNYISRLYSTIGVRSRTEAVVWAKDHNLA